LNIDLKTPAFIRDRASIRDPAFNRSFTVTHQRAAGVFCRGSSCHVCRLSPTPSHHITVRNQLKYNIHQKTTLNSTFIGVTLNNPSN